MYGLLRLALNLKDYFGLAFHRQVFVEGVAMSGAKPTRRLPSNSENSQPRRYRVGKRIARQTLRNRKKRNK